MLSQNAKLWDYGIHAQGKVHTVHQSLGLGPGSRCTTPMPAQLDLVAVIEFLAAACDHHSETHRNHVFASLEPDAL